MKQTQTVQNNLKWGIAPAVFAGVFALGFFCNSFWPEVYTSKAVVSVQSAEDLGLTADSGEFRQQTANLTREDFLKDSSYISFSHYELSDSSDSLEVQPDLQNGTITILASSQEPALAIETANAVGKTLVTFWRASHQNHDVIDRLQEQKVRIDQEADAKSKRFSGLTAQGASTDDLTAAMRDWELTKERSILVGRQIESMAAVSGLVSEAVKISSAAGPDSTVSSTRSPLQVGGSLLGATLASGVVFSLLHIMGRKDGVAYHTAPPESVPNETILPVNGPHAGKVTEFVKQRRLAKESVM